MSDKTDLPRKTGSPSTTPLEKVQAFLAENPDVRYIRFHLLDYGNTPRSRAITVKRAMEAADRMPEDTSAIGTASPATYAILNFGPILMEKANYGPDDWVPDWDTLRPVAQTPNHAMVLCNLKERFEPEKDWYSRDPRIVLARIERQAKESLDIDFRIGYEVEFELLTGDQAGPIMSPPTPWAAATYRSATFAVVEDCVEALERVDIPVWALDSGNYEISLSPQSPSLAADHVAYTHETIKTIAFRHGLHATMHPSAFPNGASVGQHIHISLSTPQQSDRETGDQFLAGMLKHLPALSAFTNGGYDSWNNSRPMFYGHGDIAWSWGKFQVIHRIDDAYYEFRLPDCLCNPHLQLAAILAAGLDGIKNQSRLTQKPTEWRIFTEPMSEEYKKEIGVTEILPKDLKGALDALRADSGVFKEALGEKCVEAYLFYRTKEVEKAEKMTFEQRRKAIVAHI